MTRVVSEAWRGPLAAYFDYLGAMGYSPATMKTRQSHLYGFAAMCKHGPADVSTGDLVAALGKCPSREYKKSMRNSFSSFFKWYGGIAKGRADNPAAPLPSIRKAQPHPMPCPDDAIREALGKATAEERLMILLAAECGLRRAEIAQVHSRDVVDDSSGRKSLIVHGKGDKQRIVPLPDDMAGAILAAHGYVFRGRWGGHVEASYIGKHVSRLLPDGYTAHKLRHRFATTAYAQSHDMLGVCKALGHASTETTMNYTALPDERLRDLVTAATMTRQSCTAGTNQPEGTPAPLPSVRPVEHTAESVKRYRNGKIRYGYQSARSKADGEAEAVRAAMILAGYLGEQIRAEARRSFRLPAEAFAEHYQVRPDGHARRGSTLRAGARLLQARGLIELKSTKDGTLAGNVITGAEQLRATMDEYARTWLDMQD